MQHSFIHSQVVNLFIHYFILWLNTILIYYMNSHRYMDTDVAIYRPMREKPNKKCRQYFACCACQVTHAKKLAQDINNLNCHIGHMSTTYLSASGIQLWEVLKVCSGLQRRLSWHWLFMYRYTEHTTLLSHMIYIHTQPSCSASPVTDCDSRQRFSPAGIWSG